MLVTSLCWWLYDGDWFLMLVAESLCWRLFSLCWWFSQCIKLVINILNRSSTSQACPQHVWSPTSVTNIDVTMKIACDGHPIAVWWPLYSCHTLKLCEMIWSHLNDFSPDYRKMQCSSIKRLYPKQISLTWWVINLTHLFKMRD